MVYMHVHSMYVNVTVMTRDNTFVITNNKTHEVFQTTYALANRGFKDKNPTGLDCALKFMLACYTNFTSFTDDTILEQYRDWWLACGELARVLNLNSYSDAVLLREAV